ncbi:hypothetical protein F5Y16DRAFT_418871 [Xylariaceae sp. FL0255]|nr:hypothetical protein F5Y16DRAFT_418871 [Xylariaceae sp. FL0255]
MADDNTKNPADVPSWGGGGARDNRPLHLPGGLPYAMTEAKDPRNGRSAHQSAHTNEYPRDGSLGRPSQSSYIPFEIKRPADKYPPPRYENPGRDDYPPDPYTNKRPYDQFIDLEPGEIGYDSEDMGRESKHGRPYLDPATRARRRPSNHHPSSRQNVYMPHEVVMYMTDEGNVRMRNRNRGTIYNAWVQNSETGMQFGHINNPRSAQDMFRSMRAFMKNGKDYSVWCVEHITDTTPREQAGRTIPFIIGNNRSYIEDASLRHRVLGREVVCAHCEKIGHALVDCIGPVTEHGDMFGCVICNTKDHSFDECRNIETLGEVGLNKTDIQWKYLFLKRVGKPLIRSNFEIWRELAKRVKNGESTDRYPWTRQFARLQETSVIIQSYDYSAAAYHQDDNFPKGLSALEAFASHHSGSYKDWMAFTKEARAYAKTINTKSTKPARQI